MHTESDSRFNYIIILIPCYMHIFNILDILKDII